MTQTQEGGESLKGMFAIGVMSGLCCRCGLGQEGLYRPSTNRSHALGKQGDLQSK